VVERPKRFINALFMEVHGFSRKHSRILHIVCAEAYFILRIVHMLPLLNLCTFIFEPSI
jgi:hypothetical protein